MDGDAWGSLWGLALVLKDMWKQVQAINDDRVPESLDFLWESELIDPDLDVEEYNPDIIISLDAADQDRLWNSYIKWKNIFDAKPLIVIDHHISNPWFWDINIIDVESSSVCELLTHILTDLNLSNHITHEAATFFYTGIQTDTHMYATSNTTHNTLLAGAKLIELWANFRLPIEKCFRQKIKEQIIAWRLAYNALKITEDWNISYSNISKEDIEKSWLELSKMSEYLKWFINETLINIQNVKVSFLLYPLESWETKWSMRSQDAYDVNTIAWKFWWGWHKQAAWLQSKLSKEDLEQQLLIEINKQLLSS